LVRGESLFKVWAEEKPLAIFAERLSGVLFGLTWAPDLRKEGVTVTYSGKQSVQPIES
jgi:hypothetical protein